MTVRNKDLVIDDLGFRAAWLEKTVQMNIERLLAIASRTDASSEDLRLAATALAEDSAKELEQLQICAVERLLVQNRITSEIVKLSPRADAAAAPEVVPA